MLKHKTESKEKSNQDTEQVHGGSEIVAARKMSFSGYPGVIYRCLKLYTGAKSDIQIQENMSKFLF